MVQIRVAVVSGIIGLFVGATMGIVMLALCIVSGGTSDEFNGYSSTEDKSKDTCKGAIT